MPVEAEKDDLPALSVENLARYMIYIPSLRFLPAALIFGFLTINGLKLKSGAFLRRPSPSLVAE
jgi:hypothetical protein